MHPIRALFTVTVATLGFTAFMPPANAQRPARKPIMQRPLQAKVIIHRVFDDRIIVAVPVSAKHQKRMRGIGFRSVSSIDRVADRTLFGPNAYVEYTVESGRVARILEANDVGKTVTLLLRRTKQGQTLVSGIRH